MFYTYAAVKGRNVLQTILVDSPTDLIKFTIVSNNVPMHVSVCTHWTYSS